VKTQLLLFNLFFLPSGVKYHHHHHHC